jgi:uncharacterized membrane protein YfcA
MNAYLLFNQNFALLFALIVAYYSFIGLNRCDKDTLMKARLALIMTFPASCGVIIYLLMGNVPHWCFTLVLFAAALKFASERRKERRAESDGRRESDRVSRAHRHP